MINVNSQIVLLICVDDFYFYLFKTIPLLVVSYM